MSTESVIAPLLKFPKAVYFIIGNEFCERFNYYGMRAILTFFLTDVLRCDHRGAKIIFHMYNLLCYLFPLCGAILADSYLGKFNTILYITMVYVSGSVLLAITAAPSLPLPLTEMTLLALFLIAIGTGGIKPCVAAFGGDQFVRPQQDRQLSAFFSFFYLSINLGSLLSMIITPMIRATPCFGYNQCFTLGFALPALLMSLALLIFVIGKPLYKMTKPTTNIIAQVAKCVTYAIVQKFKSKDKKEHWLDHAEPKYDEQLIKDIKATTRILYLFIPLPLFWALYDQQGSGWTFQARNMDGDIGFYTILADQFQVINPILIVLFIPTFEYGIYPCMGKVHLLRKPLQRIVTGGVLGGIAFVITAFIALAMETDHLYPMETNTGHFILYNNYECETMFTYNSTVKVISGLSYKDIRVLQVYGSVHFEYQVNGSCFEPFNGTFDLSEGTVRGFVLRERQEFLDSVVKSENGFPLVRVLMNVPNDTSPKLNFFYKHELLLSVGADEWNKQHELLFPSRYDIKLDDKKLKTELFKVGGIYTIMVNVKPAKSNDTGIGETSLDVFEVVPPNTVHMLWQLPQYIVMSAGEIMFSITGLEFSYSQAPVSMKSLLAACWLLTVTVGNGIVVIIEMLNVMHKMSTSFFVYAIIMFIDMGVFAAMAYKYKYVEQN